MTFTPAGNWKACGGEYEQTSRLHEGRVTKGTVRGAGQAGLLTAVLAAVLAAGCSAGPAAPFEATVQSCYAFAVQALQRHVTVTTTPRACAGLSREQIDQAVSRAVHEAAGLGPKAVARRRAAQDSRYLAYLIRNVPPASAAPGPAPLTAAPAGHSTGAALRLAALAAWIATAAAGSYLLAGWLTHGGLRGRRPRHAGMPPVIVVSHAAVAVAGLGIWLAFVASDVSVLAWIASGLILPAAGLGMATLVAGLPGSAASAGPASPDPPQPARTSVTGSAPRVRMPVIVIALHGVLATATILLVLLAAIGAA